MSGDLLIRNAELLENEFLPGDRILVDVANERLIFRKIGSQPSQEPPAAVAVS